MKKDLLTIWKQFNTLKKMAYNFQKSEVKKAIVGSGGYISRIAAKMKCDWHTAKKFIDQYQLEEFRQVELENSIDRAEIKLEEKIQEGDITAIIFKLKTQGKKRGYVERQELTGADGDKLNSFTVEIVNGATN